jgi:hypothetical protein
MTSDNDVSTTQAVAIITFFLFLLVPIAVALAWWFKQQYARAVVRLQAATAGNAKAAVGANAAAPIDERGTPAPPLRVQLIPAATIAPEHPDPIEAARRLRRRVLRTQFVSGAFYWVGLLILVALALAIYEEATGGSKDTTPAPALASWLVILTMVFAPPLLAWALQAGTRPAVVWWIVGGGAIALGAGMALMGQGLVSVLAVPLVLAALGLTMTAFLRPSIRGAGPPVIAALIVAFLVFSAFAAMAVALDDGSDDWGTWSENLRDLVLLMTVLALCAWVGWRMLLRISRRYGEKRFSELQLALGSYWGLITLFVLAAVMLVSFEEKTGGTMEWVGLFVILLWLMWRPLQRLVLRWAVRKAESPHAPLLLLRVFKPSGRSEAFMDRFLARWRFAGPTWMIAGPDLAGALMEPDEFFAYLGRRLAQRYIADAGQIRERVAALDGARDPDGRFRVSELFCANTTWQQAVLALIEGAGVIVLDLREYNPSRAGTRYELQELLRRAPLERVLFLTDEPGDAPQVRAAITEAWDVVGTRAERTAVIVQLKDESDAELDGLFRMAARAGIR